MIRASLETVLDESMELYRKATAKEKELLDLLISKSSKPVLPPIWKDSLLVQSLKDGEMGSLRLIVEEMEYKEREFGEEVSELQFVDSDGVPVIATLYIDKDGYLFELDMWKVDFTPILCLQEVKVDSTSPLGAGG